MPAPDGIDPTQARIIQEVLDRELPGFDLVSVELPRVQPAPSVTAAHRGEEDIPRSPSLETLQAHYRKALRRLSGPGRAAPSDERKDSAILRCRIRTRGAEDGRETEVLISMTERTIIKR